MSAAWIAPSRIVPADAEALERRARELAGNAAEAEEDAAAARLVFFRILGLPCAVGAEAIVRAVSRLAGATAVPTAAGGDRTVAFVEEQPLPVADLAGVASGSGRAAAELAGAPALVLSTPSGPVAVAVEGPLDLREEALSAVPLAPIQGGAAGLRLAGRLADGTSVVDAGWLVGWAEKAARA